MAKSVTQSGRAVNPYRGTPVSATMLPAVSTPKTRKPANRAPSLFAKVGADAKADAQRKLLLETWEKHGFNLTATGEALGVGVGPVAGSAVIRALKALAPAEYEKAKQDGRISPANWREDE